MLLADQIATIWPRVTLPISADTADPVRAGETAQLGKHLLCNYRDLRFSCRNCTQSNARYSDVFAVPVLGRQRQEGICAY